MMSVVRPTINGARAASKSRSEAVSRFAVGSSKIKTGAFFRSARAMARR